MGLIFGSFAFESVEVHLDSKQRQNHSSQARRFHGPFERSQECPQGCFPWLDFSVWCSIDALQCRDFIRLKVNADLFGNGILNLDYRSLRCHPPLKLRKQFGYPSLLFMIFKLQRGKQGSKEKPHSAALFGRGIRVMKGNIITSSQQPDNSKRSSLGC